ncbi:hypothetical protein J1N35_022482 [Gossypium stocksii]|uniref:Retrotransposon gag domain-containing protein n=1 Tax=Gossypium stocksii TaxID=47602 RepID=A0A9D3VGV3_9ROSI|nr:hypothetical protein J1N35_022482 [Gossypium stocksii]
MQRGTVGEYVREFKKLMLQNGLKSWVKQEVEQRDVQKLLEAMMVVESVVKLDLGKDKLGGLPSLKRGAYMKRITRKTMLMAMATIVVMGDHKLGRRNPGGKGTS